MKCPMNCETCVVGGAGLVTSANQETDRVAKQLIYCHLLFNVNESIRNEIEIPFFIHFYEVLGIIINLEKSLGKKVVL